MIEISNFNPRSYERNDLCPIIVVWYILTISIHVPTRGTTRGIERGYLAKEISIHVPTRGTTCHYLCIYFHIYKFQSTFLREERHKKVRFKGRFRDFNPRSYERNDGVLRVCG